MSWINVTFQIALSCKQITTNTTKKRKVSLFSIMYFIHVTSQTAFDKKRAGTKLTFIWLFSFMNWVNVTFQRALLCKQLITNTTKKGKVWLFSIMHFIHVTFQATFDNKRTGAKLKFIWVLALMCYINVIYIKLSLSDYSDSNRQRQDLKNYVLILV